MKARWRAGTTLAVLLAVVVVLAVAGLAIGGGVLWSLSGVPVHQDAASVPSRADRRARRALRRGGRAREAAARALAATDNIPGLSVAVAVDGEIAWAEGFGWADVDSRTPVTPRTRFRLGALSKPLTAVAAARLHEQGRLDLEAPVQRSCPPTRQGVADQHAPAARRRRRRPPHPRRQQRRHAHRALRPPR